MTDNAFTGDRLQQLQSYEKSMNSRCMQWNLAPKQERSLNDKCCCVCFFLLVILFLVAGSYFIVQFNNRVPTPTPTITIINNPSVFFRNNIGQIIASIFITFILSFLYIFLIKLCAKVMVYAMIVLSFVFLIAAAIIVIIYQQYYLLIAIILFLAIYVLILYCFRAHIETGIILVKVAAMFISQKLTVFVAPLNNIIFSLILSVFWVYSMVSIIDLIVIKNRNQDNNNKLQVVFSIIWSFLWVFFTFLFYYIMVFKIAVAVAFWYYRINRNYFTTAYKWICCSTFGSLVFAAILIAIIKVIRLLIRRNNSRNPCAKVLLCFVQCIFAQLQALLKVLNNLSVIVMAVTGESYIDAAKTTIGLVSSNFGLLSVSRLITSFLVFWGVVISTAVGTGAVYLMVQGNLYEDVVATVLIVAVVGSMISSLILSILAESISSIYIFYSFDLRFKSLGYATHNMPQELYQHLNSPDISPQSAK